VFLLRAIRGFSLQIKIASPVITAAVLVGAMCVASAFAAQVNLAQLHEKKAQEYLNQKQPKLAIPEFKAVLAADPNNLNALANLGVLLYFEQDYAGAAPYLKKAVAKQPDLAKIRALLGLAEKSLGQIAEARADLEVAVPQLAEPKIRVDAGLALIEIYAASQELDNAAAIVSLLQQVAPTDTRVLYTAYRIHSDLAGEAMLDLSLVAPESGQMHQAMAHELYRARDLGGTISNLRKAVAADQNLPGIHYELAEALHNSPDPKVRDQAEQEYKLAVIANGHEVKALSRLGDIAMDRNDLDGAMKLYQQALAVAPNETDASIGLAHVYTEKGQPEAALPLLQGVINIDPTNILAHYRLSSAYRELKRPEDAKRELEAYQKYKDIKEKMRAIYKEMRQESPQGDGEKDE
jgi:tetratricopeptide (TPR) repeat protein